MDQPTPAKPSGIPRASRLPVPSLRSTPSRESLQPSQLSISNPRLRPSASRGQLAPMRPRGPATPAKAHELAALCESDARGPGLRTPSRSLQRQASRITLFRKSSEPCTGGGPVFQEEDASPVDDIPIQNGGKLRRPRPSLSERTMETLQNIPASPAQRKSSFFDAEGTMKPPPVRSISSRPTSSAGSGTSSVHAPPIDSRASTNTFRPPKIYTPVKGPGTATSKKPASGVKSNIGSGEPFGSRLPSPSFSATMTSRSPTPVKSMASLSYKKSIPSLNHSNVKSECQTVSTRTLKPRASVNGLFRKPSMPTLDRSGEIDRPGFASDKKTATSSDTSSEAASPTPSTSKVTSGLKCPSGDAQGGTPRKPSMALRDQIAKAKAAKRAAAAAAKEVLEPTLASVEKPVIASGSFDFGLSEDPFGQQVNLGDGAKGLLRKRIESARSDGRLNITAMGFKEIPEEVMNMYNLESIAAQGGSWAESVDLVRFIAAGNELELISDNVFPDVDPRDSMDDENAKGNQFGGLETLDLHGNILIALPPGLRRLEFLTTLNLSNNKLGNGCLEVISRIPSLRHLRLADNCLNGALDASMINLKNLESLDMQRNTLDSFPDGLAELVRLRVINITENSFKSLPFESLRQLPLIELLAAKNNIAGTLIAVDADELPHLQILDVAANSITSLDLSGSLRLPALHQLSCSANRLTSLPNMESWLSLLTIAAEDNNIGSIPEGFVDLPKVRNVDFSGNNIRILDDKIGRMDNLDVFRVSGNPLREKKYAGMATEDLKRALKARMEPEVEEGVKDSGDGGDAAFYSAQSSPTSPGLQVWPVKLGGELDRSNTHSHSLNPVTAAEVAASNAVKTLQLHHNIFKEIPASIGFFAATLTTLNLSHNELNSDTFMKDDLELPALKELSLSSNTFNSLQPLIQHLQAPRLEHLDISFNRLTFLPVLRTHFPNLVTLLASNNTLRELSPECVQGLRILDCSSNDIGSLNARIGLLGGPGGLERLDVSGNRFRVPKHTILEKGTDATLAWLRDKIPAGETSSADVD